jgi:hypothetical protein
MPAASARMSLRPSAIWRGLLDGFIEAAAFGAVPHRGAVERTCRAIDLWLINQRIEYKFDYARPLLPSE